MSVLEPSSKRVNTEPVLPLTLYSHAPYEPVQLDRMHDLGAVSSYKKPLT